MADNTNIKARLQHKDKADLLDIIELVEKVRLAQREFLKTRLKSADIKATELEKQLDNILRI